MTPEDYIALYEKFLAGNCSQKEQEKLYAYRDALRMLDGAQLNEEDVAASIRAYRNIEQETTKGGIKKIRKWISIAASIALVGGVAFIFQQRQLRFTKESVKSHMTSTSITPGGYVATLTLSDGKSISLHSAANGKIAEEQGVQISKSHDGKIVYKPKRQVSNIPLTYHTIQTPRGGQFQLVLPDGTQVQLNAASSLRYPSSFGDKERVVELVGEAYFDVARASRRPFKVKTMSQTIEVLGTQFNVNTNNIRFVYTTVVTGAVRVNLSKQIQRSFSHIVNAGQESIIDVQTGEMHLISADLRRALAWKNGYFIFDNDTIQDIMEQIARWYNVEVSYEPGVTGKRFGGIYSKDKDFLELLKGLELTGGVHFKIDGRRITVMP
ncbi:FecR family protein [Olivibacter sp. XZL3]|uniref:FecR family protein n=1 Tax=Olivibacter sp. XZL3 TaxID=1735116 RepID=UPI001066D82C|nr:FecR domain-containing protein [Olivibacter sp. XZL3]